MDTDKEAMQTEAEIRLTPSMRSSEKKAKQKHGVKVFPQNTNYITGLSLSRVQTSLSRNGKDVQLCARKRKGMH